MISDLTINSLSKFSKNYLNSLEERGDKASYENIDVSCNRGRDGLYDFIIHTNNASISYEYDALTMHVYVNSINWKFTNSALSANHRYRSKLIGVWTLEFAGKVWKKVYREYKYDTQTINRILDKFSEKNNNFSEAILS